MTVQDVQRRWVERPLLGDPDLLLPAVGRSSLVAELLSRRGHTDAEDVRRFLDGRLADLPDPSGLTDLDRAVDCLARACVKRTAVYVHGDYDVDGVCSTALLVDVLDRLGVDVHASLPHRIDDGYGISTDAVERMADAGADLLVTADCGVTALEALERARERGLEVVVLDHHVPGNKLPPAAAIVDPVRDGQDHSHGPLCATAVVFMVVAGLRRELRTRGFFDGREAPNLKHYLDLVALATVADMVPLVGTNRLLVRHGLEVLAQRRRPGLAALLDVSGVTLTDPVDAAVCSFRLAPRINAAGRLADPGLALELLLTRDPARARHIAADLDQINQRRRDLEQRIVDEATRQLRGDAGVEGKRGLALLGEDWHPGVLGIVASRLARDQHRPVLVASADGDRVIASVRSIPGVDLIRALDSMGDLLLRHGGHSAAAGLSLRREDFEALRQRFEHQVFEELSADHWIPGLEHDGPLDLDHVDEPLVRQLQQLTPHGVGNPEPLFLALGAEVRGVRPVSRGALQLHVGPPPGLPAICFRPTMDPDSIGKCVDLVYTPAVRTFRGVRSIQLRVEDFRNSRSAIPGKNQ